MLASIRAAIVFALVCLASTLAHAADKAFQDADLADAAIKLEAEIKKDAGTVTKQIAVLRRELDAALARNDLQGGIQTLTQITAAAPTDAGAWLRLARLIAQLPASDQSQRTVFSERSATAAYIAYQRATSRAEEADALTLVGRSFIERKEYRPGLNALRQALQLREVADVRQLYERTREDHGFRLLPNFNVDSDASSPRVCFLFTEDLPAKRFDFSPFVSVAGMDKPALSVEERQLCVEGLKHGERYKIALRAGLPSTVHESLSRSAEFEVYVRDRKPTVRFTGRAYVLPNVGQRGIPIVSVNTAKVGVQIFRIGDRSLIDTVLGSDFQRNIERYELERLAESRGAKVWKGELDVEQTLNADVVTAFPIDQAVGKLEPGVYVMVAEPGGTPSTDYETLATQWFVISDLGITAFSGNDGVHVFVNSLASAEPHGGIEVRLLARNNEILATRTTDDGGHVLFEAGLARGEGGLSPAMLVATPRGGGDYAFLNLKQPAFDLSDRGVAGRAVPAGLDAYVFTERGVYRTGETVHVTAILREPTGDAAANVPLTMVFERPDGVEYRRAVIADAGFGGRAMSVQLASTAGTGTWKVKAFTDPRRPPVGETRFMVEDYIPDRLEFELTTEAKSLSRSTPVEIKLDGRFLYGAPASGLILEGERVINAASERPGYPGYRFGVTDEEIGAEREPIEDLPETDDAGRAQFTVTLDKLKPVNRILEADIVVRMAESGGRAVERKLTLPIEPAATMIGVKPLFASSALSDGDVANFDVVVVAPDGRPQARSGLRYELLKVESRYQWYRQDNYWHYEPVKSTKRMADGRIDVAADAPARLSLPVQWGRYRLDVTSEDGSLVTSVTFDAGFYAEASADTPDRLELATDKKDYAAGDTINVSVTARSAGKLTIAVVGDRLLSTKMVDVTPGEVRVPIEVGSDWGTGAYLVATLRRPLDQQAQRMPGRAIGVQWFGIDRAARTLAMEMPLPALVRPNTTLRVPLKLSGLAAGEEARVVVAAVDVGILNLTNYKPPVPEEYFLGQRRLTTEIRDLYNQLIDGMQGTLGQIRSGGDAAAGAVQGTPPIQPPLALFSGVVTVGADGNAEVAFDIPAFAGTVRVMAAAWSRGKLGHAVGDVTVRDPVVLTATLPRFLLNGDRGTVRLELDNVEGAAGEYRIALSAEGPVRIAAQGQSVRLAQKQRGGTSIPLDASGVGSATVLVRVSGPDGFTLERSYPLNVKPATQVLARRTVRTIAPGESLTLSSDLLNDLVAGTGAVGVSVSAATTLDVPALLRALDRYPFGCSEQIASRAMPLLYANELAAEQHIALDTTLDQRVQQAIDRLLARQGSNGAFGLWSVGGDDPWLDAYITDFLTRARERGFSVPDVSFKLALDRLKNFVGNAPDPVKDGARDIAYAYYVLARNGVAPIGDLRYIADTKLNEVATAIARAQVGAALGMMGDRVRAGRAYTEAVKALQPQGGLDFGRVDYGSSLRDAAAVVTLAAEGGAQRPVVLDALDRAEAARSRVTYMSTQEQVWLILAARALSRESSRLNLEVQGQTRQGSLFRTYRPDELREGIRIVNRGDAEVRAVVNVSGSPVQPEPAAERGFKIERSYFTLEGEPADPAKAVQNQRFAVVLKMTEPSPTFGRIIVADYLPAGFEIDNPRLVSSGDTGTLGWIQDAAEPVHTEFRDDRFAAAFERKSGDPSVFSVAYIVRAVSPGRYVLPQAYVEDMYRPDRYGRTATGSIEVQAAR